MEPKPRRRWQRAAIWAVLVLAVLIGYPLSYGPANAACLALLSERGVQWPFRVVGYLYAPVWALASLTGTKGLLWYYLAFWESLIGL